MTPPTTATSHILVVDDDRPLRDLMSVLLQEAGYVVVQAADGPEALRALADEIFDVMMLDISLPGMSGLELQARLADEKSRIPIIFITAYGDTKMQMQAMRAGAVGFLGKPFDDDVLLQSVRAALGTRAGRG